MIKPLILLGGGGYCETVIDVAECAGYTILGILDRPEEVGKRVLGYEVIGVDADMAKYADDAEFVVTVGQINSPNLRIKLHQMLEDAGCKLATIISPFAHVSKYATVGEGTVVMHQAVIDAGAKVGKGCIINIFALISHDSVIGDYCHISTGVIVNGGVRIADGTLVGSQSVINQMVNVGGGIIASGSVVRKDIPKRGIYAGNPVRLISSILE